MLFFPFLIIATNAAAVYVCVCVFPFWLCDLFLYVKHFWCDGRFALRVACCRIGPRTSAKPWQREGEREQQQHHHSIIAISFLAFYFYPFVGVVFLFFLIFVNYNTVSAHGWWCRLHAEHARFTKLRNVRWIFVPLLLSARYGSRGGLLKSWQRRTSSEGRLCCVVCERDFYVRFIYGVLYSVDQGRR